MEQQLKWYKQHDRVHILYDVQYHYEIFMIYNWYIVYVYMVYNIICVIVKPIKFLLHWYNTASGNGFDVI